MNSYVSCTSDTIMDDEDTIWHAAKSACHPGQLCLLLAGPSRAELCDPELA
jgi:hypothetical protein